METLVAVWLIVALGSGRAPDEGRIVVDPQLRSVFQAGAETSATFGLLRRQLEQSGWDLYVQSGRCPKHVVACLLHVVGRHQGRRYLRVVVADRTRHPDAVTALVAHEMQHALEVTQRGTEISDTESVGALFRRIGFERLVLGGTVSYETRAAMDVEEKVLKEVRSRFLAR